MFSLHLRPRNILCKQIHCKKEENISFSGPFYLLLSFCFFEDRFFFFESFLPNCFSIHSGMVFWSPKIYFLNGMFFLALPLPVFHLVSGRNPILFFTFSGCEDRGKICLQEGRVRGIFFSFRKATSMSLRLVASGNAYSQHVLILWVGILSPRLKFGPQMI